MDSINDKKPYPNCVLCRDCKYKVDAYPFAGWTSHDMTAMRYSGCSIDGKDLFFGLVDGFEKEWGYFSLKELQGIRGKMGLPIERDRYFGQPQIKDIRELAETLV